MSVYIFFFPAYFPANKGILLIANSKYLGYNTPILYRKTATEKKLTPDCCFQH